MHGRWITVGAGLAAAAAVALGLVGCSHKSGTEGEEGSDSQRLIAEVTVTRVVRADISQSIAVSGSVVALPNEDARVSSLVAGRITRMLVAEGDRVNQAQVLAQIEDRPFRDQLQQAEASVEQAQANLKNAQLTRARNENLFARGIAARKDLEEARTQENVTQAALSQAQAALSLARLQLSRSEVRSPIAGTVVKRFVNVGEQVDGTAAQPVYEVANARLVELLGNVPATYLGKMRVGQTLPITTDAFPGKTFSGRVVAVLPAVDPTTNLGLVRIRISNENGLLRLGMFLNVQVPIETHANALVVPPEAVYHNQQGQPQLYRVEGNTATAVPVRLGIETHDHVELLSGVQAGDTVILTGGYGLADRTQVKVKP